MDVSIELLRPIPESKLKPGTLMRHESVPYDTCWQACCKPDAWHVPVKVSSRYASMEDIKAHVEARLGRKLGNWSYSRMGLGEVTVQCGGGETMRIPAAEMESIEREHVDDYLATDPCGTWSFACMREEWPAGFRNGPVRVDAEALAAIREAESARLAASDVDGLREQLDCLDVPSLCGGRLLAVAMAAYALAEKEGAAAFLYLN